MTNLAKLLCSRNSVTSASVFRPFNFHGSLFLWKDALMFLPLLDLYSCFKIFPFLNVSSLADSLPSVCIDKNTCSVSVALVASVTPSSLLLFPLSCARARSVPEPDGWSTVVCLSLSLLQNQICVRTPRLFFSVLTQRGQLVYSEEIFDEMTVLTTVPLIFLHTLQNIKYKTRTQIDKTKGITNRYYVKGKPQ